MKFIAVKSTEDKRIIEGKAYHGQIVSSRKNHGGMMFNELRICVWDESGTWMTFDPNIFIPMIVEKK